jgi:hypothetical protein
VLLHRGDFEEDVKIPVFHDDQHGTATISGADDAVSGELEQNHPFSQWRGKANANANANALIFPDLNSANIAYKLLAKIGGGQTLGPILMGMSRPVHLPARGAEIEEIANLTDCSGRPRNQQPRAGSRTSLVGIGD